MAGQADERIAQRVALPARTVGRLLEPRAERAHVARTPVASATPALASHPWQQ